jgi:hypothetical protein
MFFGAPVRSLDDIARLRRTGFDFGEIAIANAGARRMWWEKFVTINLENLSETAYDVEPVMSDVPDLGLLWMFDMRTIMVQLIVNFDYYITFRFDSV